MNVGCFTVAVFGVIDRCLIFFSFRTSITSPLQRKKKLCRKSKCLSCSVSVVIDFGFVHIHIHIICIQ